MDKRRESHVKFRQAPGNQSHGEHKHFLPGIGHPSSTGVIYCTDRAYSLGFNYDDPEWANFGQGAPETGDIPNAMSKPTSIEVRPESLEYAPTAGTKELRTAVADLYNALYREGKESQYTFENVCIVPGGRAGLNRLAAVVDNCYLAHFIPDYTAYDQLLSLFGSFVSIPTPLDEEDGYHIHFDIVKQEIARGLAVLLTSNPRNPTGQVIEGDELKEVQDLCRDKCTLIVDEFYSGYLYTQGCNGETVSSASFVEDVDEDPLIIINGLTKIFRLPGWRICWVIGPKDLVKAISRSGSYLDGGASHPLQDAAVPLLEPSLVKKEMKALQEHFVKKRDYVVERLNDMGLGVQPPEATFYIWVDLSKLPDEIHTGLAFFEACLEEKVIVVPGLFFDINPKNRRDLSHSPCHHFIRLSFGPPLAELKRGLDGIERVLVKYGVEGKKE